MSEYRIPATPAARACEPIACSLEAELLPDRMAHWRRFAERVVARSEIDGGVRVQFDPTVSAEELVSLAARERECCSFFEFSVHLDAAGVALEVRAPTEARSLIDALLAP